jgi:hypothetical protein
MIGMPLIALAQDDELCEHLVSFASKTNVGDSLQIKLINDWANLSKSCEHNNTEAGKEFWDYLVKHTSTEFMNINLSRVLSCNESGFSFGTAHIGNISGELSLYEILKLNLDISLDIKFSVGDDNIKDFIEIKAENELSGTVTLNS